MRPAKFSVQTVSPPLQQGAAGVTVEATADLDGHDRRNATSESVLAG